MKRSCQLAAIVFTDIQDYTALMQQNEEKTIQYGLSEQNEFITNYDIFVKKDFDHAKQNL